MSNDTNNNFDIFVHDRTTGRTVRASVAANGAQAYSNYDSWISSDGRVVVFGSPSTALVSGDTNGVPDIFVRDWQSALPVRIETLNFAHQSVANYQWTPVPAAGTYDGNVVRVAASLVSSTTMPITTTVRLSEGACGDAIGALIHEEVVTVPALGSATVSGDWDTFGNAWNGDGTRRLYSRICTSVELHGAVVDQEIQLLKVLPRPVVLIHGFTGVPGTWDAFKTYLSGASTGDPDWQGYAVGDGQYPGMLNTGSFLNPAPLTNTIAQNALEVANYIEALRIDKNAWHVDLVGHSMGGLIARRYIHHDMPTNLPGGGPLVSHLVMLGTPNAGTCYALPFANGVLLQPAVSELTPTYVGLIFNPLNAIGTMSRSMCWRAI
ncbi:MAG: alpha/beta fold hydrolase [Chloroflexi bacterium]|nr:alpha/beta fold hydrolase [Chloroflexota bacterium]